MALGWGSGNNWASDGLVTATPIIPGIPSIMGIQVGPQGVYRQALTGNNRPPSHKHNYLRVRSGIYTGIRPSVFGVKKLRLF